LLIGTVLIGGFTIAHGNTVEAERAYLQGLAAVEEHRHALALEHVERAAEKGHRDAQSTAGLMLLYGPALYPN
jgi:TPR repeat protein